MGDLYLKPSPDWLKKSFEGLKPVPLAKQRPPRLFQKANRTKTPHKFRNSSDSRWKYVRREDTERHDNDDTIKKCAECGHWDRPARYLEGYGHLCPTCA